MRFPCNRSVDPPAGASRACARAGTPPSTEKTKKARREKNKKAGVAKYRAVTYGHVRYV